MALSVVSASVFPLATGLYGGLASQCATLRPHHNFGGVPEVFIAVFRMMAPRPPAGHAYLLACPFEMLIADGPGPIRPIRVESNSVTCTGRSEMRHSQRPRPMD